MPHPKSVYQVTADGMQEKFAMSQDEEWAYYADGWYGHPEDARFHAPKVEEKKDKKLSEMDRGEIVVYAKTLGVHIDKRKSKINMLKELEETLK